MKNKKLSFLSLFLAFSLMLPIHADESIWTRYFSWLAIGSLWDNTRKYVFHNKSFEDWAPEIVSLSMGHAATQIIASGIISASICAWQQTGGRLWTYWKFKREFQKQVTSLESKIKLTDEQVLDNLPEKTKSFQHQVLHMASGAWIEHQFLLGFYGNGKSGFLEWLAQKAKENKSKNAAYVKFFPMGQLKALFDKNEGQMEYVLDQIIQTNLKLRPNQNTPFGLLVDDSEEETTKFREQFYATIKNVMSRYRGQAFLTVAGNFDLPHSIQSRFNEIAIFPNPSIREGIKTYNHFFSIMAPGKNYTTSFLDEEYVKDTFRDITYLSLYQWLDKRELDVHWLEAKKLKDFFGADKSVLSLRDWSNIAASVIKRADEKNVTDISQDIFESVMEDHIYKSRCMLKSSIDKSGIIPANIDGMFPIKRKKHTKLPMKRRRQRVIYAPAITSISSNKSKSYTETKLTLGAPGYDLSGMYSSTANLPSQPPASFPIDINNNNALVSLASTMEGSPLSSLSTVEGDK